MINKRDLEEIDRLHSEWSRLDKTAKLELLIRKKVLLNGLINQFTQMIAFKGGVMNEVDRAYTRKLLEMKVMLNAEGTKVTNELTKDAFMELVKNSIK